MLRNKKLTTKEPVCKDGLWYYSRHPNYFFEICIWISYAIFAAGSVDSWWEGLLDAITPIFMAVFIVLVTGIGVAEKGSVKARGQPYIDYQKTTSMIIPWPPKSLPAEDKVQ